MRLSTLLARAPPLLIVPDLVEKPTGSLLVLQYDFFKIAKVVDDICVHLQSVVRVLTHIEHCMANDPSCGDLGWFCDGREAINSLLNDAAAVDAIIAQLLPQIDLALNAPHQKTYLLLAKFETTANLLLDAKKHIFTVKRSVDVAINYRELTENIMGSLEDEIGLCLRKFSEIRQLKLSSPRRHLPKFDLATIVSKMQVHDLSLSTNYSVKSMQLPTFSEIDHTLYSEYLAVEARIAPLNVSLDFLPMKTGEFRSMCGTLYPDAVSYVDRSYERVIEKWESLQSELAGLKKESLDKKWNEIFAYLIQEVGAKSEAVSKTLLEQKRNVTPEELITDEIGSSYKLCSNLITLINRAFVEKVITEADLIKQFNEILLPKWETLNQLVSNTSSKTPDVLPSPRTEFQLDSNGLRKFQTVKRDITPPEKITKNTTSTVLNGLGLDLGMDIKSISSQVPFSIQQKERVKDFIGTNPSDEKKRSLKQALMRLNGTDSKDHNGDEDDDAATLVHNPTPKLDIFSSRDSIVIRDRLSKLRISTDIDDLFERLKKTPQRSRLPSITADYIKLGLPVLKKKQFAGSQRTRIPSISPNHPVFMSPEKTKQRPKQERLLDPPQFLMKPDGPDSADFFRKPHGKVRVISTPTRLNSAAGKFGTLSNTPNLQFRASSSPERSYMSTSPERPSSSLGSRFEEAHLMAPVSTSRRGQRL